MRVECVLYIETETESERANERVREKITRVREPLILKRNC